MGPVRQLWSEQRGYGDGRGTVTVELCQDVLSPR